jgi:hypothetical protein
VTLESVRDFKAEVMTRIIGPFVRSPAGRAALRVRARVGSDRIVGLPSCALGIVRRRQGDYGLAVRLQQRVLEGSALVDRITARRGSDVEVRYIGRVVKRAVPWYRRPQRPLRIGCSIGHREITGSGTLAAFVRDRQDGVVLTLSNNHVLARENRAQAGDVILQPGLGDGGTPEASTIGALRRFVPLASDATNLVDVAVATLADGVECRFGAITDVGPLTGINSEILPAGTPVVKVGRTTGLTFGQVRAFEVDNVVGDFELGPLRFDDQIEVESTEGTPFSQDGDSGALVVDAEGRAVGVLFAGSDQGGTDGQGMSYVNPLGRVLDTLGVDFL